MNKQIKNFLIHTCADSELMNWTERIKTTKTSKIIKIIWLQCPRVDWFIWFALNINIDKILILYLTCDLIKSALHYQLDEEPNAQAKNNLYSIQECLVSHNVLSKESINILKQIQNDNILYLNEPEYIISFIIDAVIAYAEGAASHELITLINAAFYSIDLEHAKSVRSQKRMQHKLFSIIRNRISLELWQTHFRSNLEFLHIKDMN